MVFGRIDAINLVDLEMRLRRMELDLVSGEPVSNRSLLGSGSVPRREIIHFCFHLQQLVRAGVPILEGLTDLRDSLEHPRFREVVASLIESIEGGQTLSQAMESHGRVFSKVFVSLIRAGEATGRLPEVLHSLNESLKWEDELASQTKKMIAYPAFVGTIVLAATCFLMVYMVPQLKLFVKNMGQTLPLQTRILFFISDLMVAYWYVLLVLPLMVALGLRLLLTSVMLTTGWLLSLFQRAMVGCFTSRGNPLCTAAMRSRTSCMALAMSVFRPNSMLMVPTPSLLRDVMRLTPAMLLTASSTGLMTSRSTASGLAPG